MRRTVFTAIVAAAFLGSACSDSTGPDNQGQGNNNPIVASVEVSTSGTGTLNAVGDSLQYAAEAKDASGATIAGKTFTWASSNTAIATVNSSGLAIAVGNGTAQISATADGISGSSDLIVDLPPMVSLSFTTGATAGGPPGAAPFGAAASAAIGVDTVVVGDNTLIVTKAEIVLREIELKRLEVVDCDVEPEPEGCESFETAPVLIDLPLGIGTEQTLSIEVPPGTYTEVEFDIHKVSGDEPADSAFIANNPTFDRVSIRVTGSFIQGTDTAVTFTYESDLNVEQELQLPGNLVITEATTETNVTIKVNLASWFVDANGGLINPATGNKGETNEGLVEENIKTSMEAFEDEDKDGEDDNSGSS